MIKTKMALKDINKSSLHKKIIKVFFELSEFTSTLEGSAHYIVNKTRDISKEEASFFFRGKKLLATNGGVEPDNANKIISHLKTIIFSEDNGVDEESLVCWFRIGRNRIVYKFDSIEKLNDSKAILKILNKLYSIHFQKFKFSFLKATKRLFYLSLVTGFIVGGFVIKVPQKALAPFSVVSHEVYPQRSRIRGTLDFIKNDSESVKEGDLIATIDTRDVDFDIRESLHKIQELRIKIEVARKASLTEKSRISEVELLKITLARENVALDKLRFFKGQSEIFASQSGTIRYVESVILQGSYLNPGDLLFNIESDGEKKIESHLNEEDYGVLTSLQKVDYYFFHDPENTTVSNIISIDNEVSETFDNDFAYAVDIKLMNQKIPLGTRGYVQFKSEEVSFFYYFFRKAIILFRGF